MPQFNIKQLSTFYFHKKRVKYYFKCFIPTIDALQNFTGGDLSVTGANATAGIWSTYPAAGISQGNGFGDQIFGTFLLLLCVRGITDEKNTKVPGYLAPFLVGLVVLNIGLAFGYNCGYAINPARDLGPRMFTLMCGYGTEVFRYVVIILYIILRRSTN